VYSSEAVHNSGGAARYSGVLVLVIGALARGAEARALGLRGDRLAPCPTDGDGCFVCSAWQKALKGSLDAPSEGVDMGDGYRFSIGIWVERRTKV
jgi:hypothetical protein